MTRTKVIRAFENDETMRIIKILSFTLFFSIFLSRLSLSPHLSRQLYREKSLKSVVKIVEHRAKTVILPALKAIAVRITVNAHLVRYVTLRVEKND